MAKIIGLPKLSPTMEEGTLASWAKKEGDAIGIDDLLAEVETDKATMEFRSFDRGVLLKILAPEGAVLKADQPVAIIGKAGEDISDLLAQLKEGGGAAAPSVPASAPAASAEAPASSASGASASPAAPASSASGASASPAAPASSASPARDGRNLASPLVRRLARERSLDLSQIEGSGPRGRIIKRDLEGAVAAPAAKAPAAASSSFERLPPVVEAASSMRKTIARRLSESKREVPHYYLTIDVDASALSDARAQINALLSAGGDKVSLNDIIIKACAVALRRVPGVNASWVDGSVHRHRVVDVSVAVAIPDGLITPVIRDADRKGVLEIAREVRELAGRAKAKKLAPEEFTGGTFSISNLGMYGIDEFSAVINPPEGAILAVGAVRDEPVVRDGAVVPGKRMRVTLSADHRVIDGAVGAEFLAALRGLLEAPTTMLI